MNCPKCDAPMEEVTFGAIAVDRCTRCRGLWFDVREKERLKPLVGSERIDVGDRKAGAAYNRVDRIDCPVCRVRMIRMVDPGQPHLWFESCPVCHGAFLDAGEFEDFKEETVLDLIKGLVAGERE